MPDLRILTVDQVAELVQLSPKSVLRAIAAGQLEAARLTQGRGGWRVEEDAVRRWIACRSNLAPVLPARASSGAGGDSRQGSGRRAGALRVAAEMGRP